MLKIQKAMRHSRNKIILAILGIIQTYTICDLKNYPQTRKTENEQLQKTENEQCLMYHFVTFVCLLKARSSYRHLPLILDIINWLVLCYKMGLEKGLERRDLKRDLQQWVTSWSAFPVMIAELCLINLALTLSCDPVWFSADKPIVMYAPVLPVANSSWGKRLW